MLRKLLALTLTAFTMLLGLTPAMAEFPAFENQIPTEPFETDQENLHVTAVYSAETNTSLYTITLKDAARFPDGTAVTADDLVFTFHVCLDPGYQGEADLESLNIAGLENYRLQLSPENHAKALDMMAALEAAGRDHVWNESDGWTREQQDAYWEIADNYDAACTAEYPVCVQKIVDAATRMLANGSSSAFDLPYEEIADNEGMLIANAMVTWGYAFCENTSSLTSNNTRTVWELDKGIYPAIDDFVAELQAVYGNDLASCWATESTGDYEPALPDRKIEFMKILAQEAQDSVPAISGIRKVDDRTVEIELTGVDLRSEAVLLSIPMLSRSAYGEGLESVYGHAAAVESAVNADSDAHTVQLMEIEVVDAFFF